MKAQIHNLKSEFRSPNEIRGPNPAAAPGKSGSESDFGIRPPSRRAVAPSQRVGFRPSLLGLLTLLFCLLTSALCPPAFAQGTAFTYQGRLNDGTNPANGQYDLQFILFNLNQFGFPVGPILTNANVTVNNGIFTRPLDFGPGIFNGSNYWLEIYVRTNGTGAFNVLTPRQPITPTPYAVFAGNVGGAGLAGVYPNAVTFNNAANSFSGSFTGNGGGLTNVTATTLGGFGPNQFWKTTGNSNTVAGSNFLGTTDNQPLELRVNGLRALRLEPTANNLSRSNLVNVVNGSPINFVAAGVRGATIGGGGAAIYDGMAETNSISADVGTIAGGAGNTLLTRSDGSSIGGGSRNRVLGAFNAVIAGGVDHIVSTNADEAVIGGGDANRVGSLFGTISGGAFHSIDTNSDSCTIGGGYFNTIQNNSFDITIGGGSYHNVGTNSHYATIGGGRVNFIGNNASSATIAGGIFNTASAPNSAIPGGDNNNASAMNSFAAGHRAKALHTGSFVWGDSTEQDISSTGTNQFLIRASGGVAINTNNPSGAALRVAGRPGDNISVGTPQVPLHIITSGEAIRLQGQSNGVANLAYMSFVNSGGTRTGYVGDGGGADNSIHLTSDSGSVNLYTAIGAALSATASGNVGIGTTTPSTQLHVLGPEASQFRLQNSVNGKYWNIYSESFNNSGNLVFTPDVGIGGFINRSDGFFYSLSDVRLKRDIIPLSGVLNRVLQLRPVSYQFKSQPSQAPRTYGFIAQEVESLFPEVVGAHEGMKALAYSELVPVTISAIQELNRKVESQNAFLREELKRRDAENAELRQRLDALEKAIHHSNSK